MPQKIIVYKVLCKDAKFNITWGFYLHKERAEKIKQEIEQLNPDAYVSIDTVEIDTKID